MSTFEGVSDAVGGGTLTAVPTGRQFAQQRLKKGAVIGGWVSSFYLLLPAGLTPFLGIYIDVYGKRIGFRTSTLYTVSGMAVI